MIARFLLIQFLILVSSSILPLQISLGDAQLITATGIVPIRDPDSTSNDSSPSPDLLCPINRCQNGGTCYYTNSERSDLVCMCPSKFTGRWCDDLVVSTSVVPLPPSNCSNPSICRNGGTCYLTDFQPHFACTCLPGLTGQYCENDVVNTEIPSPPSHTAHDEVAITAVHTTPEVVPSGESVSEPSSGSPSPCTRYPCFNYGECVAVPSDPDGYQCRCSAEWTGKRCEMDFKECDAQPCLNGATCEELPGSYRCLCVPGYSGSNCELIQNCASNPCKNGGVCKHVSAYDFQCDCTAFWTGKSCDERNEPCANHCLNGATCNIQPTGTPSCGVCPPGFTGDRCEVDINDCVDVTCPTGKHCVDQILSYKCACPSGLSGPDCSVPLTNLCAQDPYPCQNQATCQQVTGNTGSQAIRCICRAGYEGSRCELDVNECEKDQPCVYGRCENKIGGYFCHCNPGYGGTNCDRNTNDCENDPCENDGVCIDGVSSVRCLCPHPFTGDRCESRMEACANYPCHNQASCIDINGGSFQCICPNGVSGNKCQNDVFDECQSNPCPPLSQCVDKAGSYDCVPGGAQVSGVRFQPDTLRNEGTVDGCASSPCENEGTCYPQHDDPSTPFTCACLSAYSGLRCETDINECESLPCQHGGTCVEKSKGEQLLLNGFDLPSDREGMAGFHCVCAERFNGSYCELTVDDPCLGYICQNGGTCKRGILDSTRPNDMMAMCDCPAEFEGRLCEMDRNECTTEPSICSSEHSTDCINSYGDYNCMCETFWGGKNCSVELEGCRHQPCSSPSICIPYMDGSGAHKFNCECPGGLYGPSCDEETTMSFSEDSQIVQYRQNLPDKGFFSLDFDFRTTLNNSVLASGYDVLGVHIFTLELTEGNVQLRWGTDITLLSPLHKAERRGLPATDVPWVAVSMRFNSSANRLTLAVNGIESAKTFTDISLKVFLCRIGGAGLVGPKFIGCMRDVSMDGTMLIPSKLGQFGDKITAGCDRVPQCSSSDQCNGHGYCIDMWTDYTCSCEPPYQLPHCEYMMPAGTFGVEGSSSYARVDVSQQNADELLKANQINVTMMIRTTSESGRLFYIGTRRNTDSEIDTFIALEIVNGSLKANVKLHRNILNFMQNSESSTTVSDGAWHRFRLMQDGKTLVVKVDNEIAINRTMNYNYLLPLIATYVYVGGSPDGLAQRAASQTYKPKRRKRQDQITAIPLDAFTTPENFKGAIEELRINDKLVQLFPPTGPIETEVFASAKKLENVKEGVISDDMCSQQGKCLNGGQCIAGFNSYRCECSQGFRGRDCSLMDYCAVPNSCPTSSECSNSYVGYECKSASTLSDSSYASLYPSVDRENGSSLFNYYKVLAWFPQNIDSVSVSFRTRKTNALLFTIGDEQNWLTLTLNDGFLEINYKMNDVPQLQEIDSSNTGLSSFSDGQWHNFSVTFNDRQNIAIIDRKRLVFTSFAPTTTSLGSIVFGDLSQNPSVMTPKIWTGKVPLDRVSDGQLPRAKNLGFKGCIEDFQLFWSGGSLNDLDDFDSYSVAVQLFDKVTSQLNRSPVKLQTLDYNNIKIGCRGDDVCGTFSTATCKNDAKCSDLWNAFQCSCLPGFEGQMCEVNIDECVSNQCSVNSECVDGINSYSCKCNAGYMGQFCHTDINECEPNPCQHGAICTDRIADFNCSCSTNFTGKMCEFLVTYDCSGDPCQNGATCTDHTVNGRKQFKCACRDGYEGERCENEHDFCQPMPCDNNATLCVSSVISLDYQCTCRLGFEGKRCQTNIDDCAVNPCQNGATCSDGVNGFTCECHEGWKGDKCEMDVDECEQSVCQNGASCLNSPGSFKCECPKFYIGDFCEHAGTCLKDPCLNGECEQHKYDAATYNCVCGKGYEGTNCDTEIDWCAPRPCQNNAQCTSSPQDGFQCHCVSGFTGKVCETNIDDCPKDVCKNNGTCQDLINDYECNCDRTGYEGKFCDQDRNECALGECKHGVCTNMPGTFSCSCNKGYLGKTCSYKDPCLSNTTMLCQNEGTCTKGRLTSNGKGTEHDCFCNEGFEGRFCQNKIAQGQTNLLLRIVIPIVAIILLLCCIGLVAFFCVARQKRANQGTYSPSRQEISGRALGVERMMKAPPEERLI